jgi:hypothetical protein
MFYFLNFKTRDMEPITTTAMISGVVGYLAKKIKDNKSVQDLFTDFTSATVRWFRPLLLTDDNKPKEILEDLKADPTDKLNTDAVENALAKALKKDPQAEIFIKEMYDFIKTKESKGEGISLVNSKNVVVGSTIKADGSVTIGDNNTTTHQTHYGSGDNVSGGKTISYK